MSGLPDLQAELPCDFSMKVQLKDPSLTDKMLDSKL